jgi:hypothetical protein
VEPLTPQEELVLYGMYAEYADRFIARIKADAWGECAAEWDRYCIGVREYNEGQAAFPDVPRNPYREEAGQ